MVPGIVRLPGIQDGLKQPEQNQPSILPWRLLPKKETALTYLGAQTQAGPYDSGTAPDYPGAAPTEAADLAVPPPPAEIQCRCCAAV